MNTSIINNVFESFTVRTVIIEGDPWFIAKDVAEALGYKRPDQAVANHCDEAMNLPPEMRGSLDSRLKVINDSDVYSLIMGSKLAAAKRFKKWVTSVVLRNLAENGGYSVGQETLSPEMQEMINQRHRATRLVIAHRSGVLTSPKLSKADSEKADAILHAVAMSCVMQGTEWNFETEAAGAIAKAGLTHRVKVTPLNMAKAQDDKWIHAKKHDIQVKKHKAEGNGWG
ncbi:BRO-N domain-containing protein [Pantoea stewartii subsp. indologenes]|uniref:BRO-N domain-containing protein n=1 Tax=Pantoea stewartii TaxID=66269 RepID=UPI003FA48038